MTNCLYYLTKRIKACQQTFLRFCGEIDNEKQRVQSGRKKKLLFSVLNLHPLAKEKMKIKRKKGL